MKMDVGTLRRCIIACRAGGLSRFSKVHDAAALASLFFVLTPGSKDSKTDFMTMFAFFEGSLNNRNLA